MINPADHLRRNRERIESDREAAIATNGIAAAALTVGQEVEVKHGFRYLRGSVVAIEDSRISVEIEGRVRIFSPSFVSQLAD